MIMRSFFKQSLLVIAAVACLTLLMSADTGYSQATFPVKSHDFGVIEEEGGPVSTTFEFVNTGNKPLIIVDAYASCGCTRPEFPTKPIKPGKKGKIKVTYSPLGRPGAFRKTVKVVTNGREKRVTLTIEGTVKPGSRK